MNPEEAYYDRMWEAINARDVIDRELAQVKRQLADVTTQRDTLLRVLTRLDPSLRSENEHDPDPAQKAHAVLARDLRVITGLPAGTLGSALGVTREQFQRWVAGKAISPIRHGQLSYLHTIANDLIRRLGEEQARVWWHTPTSEGITPQEMLSRRLIDSVHQLVASLPDASPIVDGVIVALPPQMPYDIENDAPSDLDDVPGPWSPNDGATGGSRTSRAGLRMMRDDHG